jgi:hypothetical protein
MLKSRVFPRVLLIGLSSLLLLFAAAGLAATDAPVQSRPLPQSTPVTGSRIYLPLISRNYPNTEWSQHAHNAQRTSFTDQVVPTPWRWKWAWNGPNSTGGISSGKFGLPRNSQPVTGGGRVYIAAGSRGVYALNQSNGTVAWNRNPGGSINSTPAYDGDTNALFVVSSNGTLYKLNAENGNTIAQFASGASSTLPLPPAVISDRVFFSMGNRVYAVNKVTMAQLWSYDAGAPVHTPPAYSPSRNRVIAVSSDLFVHAIENGSGARAWRVKPTVRTGGNPGDSNAGVAEVAYGWPVIAEVHGYVFVKLRLDWQALWVFPWPPDNATMRQNLTSRPEYQALLVLDLDDGSKPFTANIGHGGYGDGGYLPMGPQPVIKRLNNGQEVAYIAIRGDNRYDNRWDTLPGEMVLDDTTVPGLTAGYVRWIDSHNFTNSQVFFPTDEQPYVSMAGDYLFFAHWEAGVAYQITDRSASRGSYQSRISTSIATAMVTSQDDTGCAFSARHYCANGLTNTRSYPPGFYIYYRQGAVYDRYWSEYAEWVVSNGLILFVSTDGAVAALEAGSPTGQSNAEPVMVVYDPLSANAPNETALAAPAVGAESVIPYEQAAAYAGQVRTVEGMIRLVFNNRKAVYLGFQNPHQGAFKIRIMDDVWGRFPAPPESLYAVNQRVRVTGLIRWYQGDPVIYVTDPAQIEVLDR